MPRGRPKKAPTKFPASNVQETGQPGRTGLPWVDPKTGKDPSSDRDLSADERLAWMEKQQEAMKRGE